MNEISLAVLHSATQDHVVGTAFWIGRSHILTCAHVVAAALGKTEWDVNYMARPSETIALREAGNRRRLIQCRVHPRGWEPVDGNEGDIALLEVVSGETYDSPIRLSQSESNSNVSIKAFGFPYPSGEICQGVVPGRVIGSRSQISGNGIQKIRGGYSGAAVVNEGNCVIGMVVTSDLGESGVANMIDMSHLKKYASISGVTITNIDSNKIIKTASVVTLAAGFIYEAWLHWHNTKD